MKLPEGIQVVDETHEGLPCTVLRLTGIQVRVEVAVLEAAMRARAETREEALAFFLDEALSTMDEVRRENGIVPS